jgi:COP9 signalosome complex subunit 4
VDQSWPPALLAIKHINWRVCVYARILDKNRKFLSAASRYYDLSALGNETDIIDADDLLEFLGRAATCAILAPSSTQRQRILGMVYNDERLGQLDYLSHFATHSSILSKMYRAQVIRRDMDLTQFEDSLANHQKAIMGDGLTIFQRALIEHNMVAASQIYSSIYFTALGQLLGLSKEKTEKVASKMILDGSLKACIDQVDGILCFDAQEDSHVKKLMEWDGAITSFCMQMNSVVDQVRQNV